MTRELALVIVSLLNKNAAGVTPLLFFTPNYLPRFPLAAEPAQWLFLPYRVDTCTCSGLCCTNQPQVELPPPQTDLSRADRLRRAQCCEAIHNRCTDLKLGHLPVKVP